MKLFAVRARRRGARLRRDVHGRVIRLVVGTDCKVCPVGQLVFLEKKLNIDGTVNDIYVCDSCFVVTNLHAFSFDVVLQAQASATFYKLDDMEAAEIQSLVENHKRLLSYVTPFLGGTAGRSVLEIGSGRGTLLVAAKRLGYRKAIGVDPNLETFEVLKARFPVDDDIVVYRNIEDVQEQVDCAVMWHTLEHIPFPRVYLEKLGSRLKVGGILFLQVPQYFQPYVCSTHYHFFNEPSFRLLMAMCRFQVLEILFDLENQFTTLVAKYDPARVSGGGQAEPVAAGARATGTA